MARRAVFSTMGDVLAEGGAWVPWASHPRRIIRSGLPARWCCEPTFELRPWFPLGKHIDLEFHVGEVTALTGAQRCEQIPRLPLTLAGLLEPLAGHVRMAERMVPPHRQ